MQESEASVVAKRMPDLFGTPQGGVISPLAANIYLHLLDEAVNEKCRVLSGYTPCTVRYADDLVILCNPGEGEGLKERLERVDIVSVRSSAQRRGQDNGMKASRPDSCSPATARFDIALQEIAKRLSVGRWSIKAEADVLRVAFVRLEWPL